MAEVSCSIAYHASASSDRDTHDTIVVNASRSCDVVISVGYACNPILLSTYSFRHPERDETRRTLSSKAVYHGASSFAHPFSVANSASRTECALSNVSRCAVDSR